MKLTASTSCLSIEIIIPTQQMRKLRQERNRLSYWPKVIQVIGGEARAETRLLCSTKPWCFNNLLTFGPKKRAHECPTPSRSGLDLAGLLSGTSPRQLAFGWPTLGKKKVGLGHRAPRFCVTAQLGHLWDKNANHILGWEVREPSCGAKVLSLPPAVPE